MPALATMVKLYGGKVEAARPSPELETLVQAHPTNAGLHFLLAIAYYDAKDLDRSETSLKKAMELDPKLPDAYALLANIDSWRGV